MLKLLLKAAKEVLQVIVDPQLLSKNDSFIVAVTRLTIENKFKILVLRSYQIVLDAFPLPLYQTEELSNE